MQTASPAFREDTARHATLVTHTQAVERAIQVMHTHLQELLTLEDLASVACLSPFHFHQVIREVFFVPSCYTRENEQDFYHHPTIEKECFS